MLLGLSGKAGQSCTKFALSDFDAFYPTSNEVYSCQLQRQANAYVKFNELYRNGSQFSESNQRRKNERMTTDTKCMMLLCVIPVQQQVTIAGWLKHVADNW